MKKNEEIAPNYDSPELSGDEQAFLDEIPPDGSPETHHSVYRALGWDDLRFWKARDGLVQRGLIKTAPGKMGVAYQRTQTEPLDDELDQVDEVLDEEMGVEVPELARSSPPSMHSKSHAASNHLTSNHTASSHSVSSHVSSSHTANGHAANGHTANGHTTNGHAANAHPANNPANNQLHEFFASAIEKWALENHFANYFIEVMSRSTKSPVRFESRPDLVLASLETFQFLPNKYIELLSFTVRGIHDWSLQAVFETASFSRFSNRSFVALQKDLRTGPPAGLESRIEEECRRLGVGLIVFEDPGDYSTFQFKVGPRKTFFEPREADRLLESFSTENRAKLLRWIR